MVEDFKPKIIGFFCNWCTYPGIDLAAKKKYEMPTTIAPIRVMCSGRVAPTMILNAFLRGADGIMVAGCHPGECHYVTGNLNARRRFFLVRNLLDFLGIEPERFQVTWCSAAEGQKWADVVDEVCESVSRIGPFEAYREMTSSLVGPPKEIEATDD